MNFRFQNFWKDFGLTLVGIFISSLVILVTLGLMWKGKLTAEQATTFLSVITPAIYGLDKRLWKAREIFYYDITKRNPAFRIFLQGWLNRLNSFPKEIG